MPFTLQSAKTIFPNTQVADAVRATVESFNQLSAKFKVNYACSHI